MKKKLILAFGLAFIVQDAMADILCSDTYNGQSFVSAVTYMDNNKRWGAASCNYQNGGYSIPGSIQPKSGPWQRISYNNMICYGVASQCVMSPY